MPEEFAFGLVEAPMTQREAVFEDGRKTGYNQGYKECARELISEFDSMLNLVCAMTGLNITAYGKYAEIKKKYTEDK